MTNDKKDRYVPSKRVKAWHRKTGDGKSLRVFAREMFAAKDVGYECARDWMTSKGVRP